MRQAALITEVHSSEQVNGTARRGSIDVRQRDRKVGVAGSGEIKSSKAK
jgi:hypothetical protein